MHACVVCEFFIIGYVTYVPFDFGKHVTPALRNSRPKTSIAESGRFA